MYILVQYKKKSNRVIPTEIRTLVPCLSLSELSTPNLLRVNQWGLYPESALEDLIACDDSVAIMG